MTLELFSLADRTALVTGASRGIGEAIARAFGEAGADVALAARSRDALEDVAAGIAAGGRRAVPIECDVTRREDIRRCVHIAQAELGRIDVLVNNAGAPLFNALALAVSDEGWQKLLDLNLTSVFHLCREVGAGMVARGSGSVINVASVVANRPWPALAGYTAAKTAVVSLTQVLAQEWGPSGVRVNAICPGWVMTDINTKFLAEERAATIAVESVPMARLGAPEDIVGTVIYLASDASRYVTGASIAIDGGLALGTSEDWRALRIREARRADPPPDSHPRGSAPPSPT
ncbi:MAG TPA: glucose 1-dehydrogenase [Solirubrobacteraceae bacterium]|jgi:NAD(P)-dependent dehydrogenase (short-subunit alcohol dehydrogenase family)|nr:glucose 1-dehydrogenase [Solirubrobacteraceae bacterium]